MFVILSPQGEGSRIEEDHSRFIRDASVDSLLHTTLLEERKRERENRGVLSKQNDNSMVVT